MTVHSVPLGFRCHARTNAPGTNVNITPTDRFWLPRRPSWQRLYGELQANHKCLSTETVLLNDDKVHDPGN